MGKVITDISKYPTAKDGRCDVPIPVEDGMGEFVEGCRKCDEECRRHN